MSMRIAAFNGSPKGRSSATYLLVEAFLEGASGKNAEVVHHVLSEKDISHCKGCFGCWLRTPGRCVIKDDMRELTKELITADLAVLAFPLYVDDVPGLMKDFLDRLIPLLDPHFERDPQGESRHVRRYESYPRLVIISNCGFPERSHFQVVSHHFRRIARNMHTDVLEEIYLCGGGMLTMPSPLAAPFKNRYLRAMKRAGREMCEKGVLTERTRKALKRPLIPERLYFEGVNRGFDSILSHSK
ncbi:MAG: flavodoxin family protein [Candidatus Thermoplasmatota archaeon]|jgi:hypothetical protein|nr:flavodoxin family protein [Candidatus Thermoplasmatota archaeon]